MSEDTEEVCQHACWMCGHQPVGFAMTRLLLADDQIADWCPSCYGLLSRFAKSVKERGGYFGAALNHIGGTFMADPAAFATVRDRLAMMLFDKTTPIETDQDNGAVITSHVIDLGEKGQDAAELASAILCSMFALKSAPGSPEPASQATVDHAPQPGMDECLLGPAGWTFQGVRGW